MPNYGHHRSDRIFAVLQPTSGIRDEMVRRGVKPHNHARDNVINLRAMQKLNRERREAAAAAAATALVPTSWTSDYATWNATTSRRRKFEWCDDGWKTALPRRADSWLCCRCHERDHDGDSMGLRPVPH